MSSPGASPSRAEVQPIRPSGAPPRRGLSVSLRCYFAYDDSKVLTQDERRRLVGLSIVLGLPATVAFVAFNLAAGLIGLAIAEAVSCAPLMVALLLIRHGNVFVPVAEWLTLLWGGLVAVALLVFGGAAGSGVMWVVLFPFLAFFLRGHRAGWLVCAAWIVVSLLARLASSEIPQAWQFPPGFTAQLFAAMVFATLMAAAFNLVRAQFSKVLHERVAVNTAQARRYLRELEYRALHDPVTNLLNRTGLQQAIERAVSSIELDSGGLVVAHLHFERFAEITNVLGPQGLEDLARAVAETLRRTFGPRALLGRLRVDEFVIGVRTSEAGGAAAGLLDELRALPLGFFVAGSPIHLDCTIGCAVYRLHARSAQELLRKAEQAQMLAREKGLREALYDIREDERFIRRNLLFGQLREALRNDELSLWFQPKLDLGTGRVIGAEALARWRTASGEYVPPREFIALAEQSGLIKPLTLWMLRELLAHVQRWDDEGLKLRVAGNLSAHNLSDPQFVDEFEQMVGASGVDRHGVVFEVTETAFARNPEQFMRAAERLRNMGFLLSIDDFGTGHASITYIRDLPAHEVKIDGSFVGDVARNPRSAAVVRAMIAMARDLGVQVVAESIEDAETAAVLRAMGCHAGQGYFFSPPMPADEFAAFVRSRLPAPPPGA
jgi:diguanylate cyclase (GGDEF)-like protein